MTYVYLWQTYTFFYNVFENKSFSFSRNKEYPSKLQEMEACIPATFSDDSKIKQNKKMQKH